MLRSLGLFLGAAVLGTGLALSPSARADTLVLADDCSYEYSAGCSANCTAGSINCNVQYVDSCAESCTATPATSCSTACETKCKTDPGTFSCSTYCSDQCETECSTNNFYGCASETDCVTACQGQCSYSCNVSPPTTTCATECDTSCTATENIACSVKCQVKKSESCNITPATCTESCGSDGGVIVCNGQVVYVASSDLDAAQWYIAHLDKQFDSGKFSVAASCSGNECSVKASCAASPGRDRATGAGLLLAAFGFVGFGVSRRRARRP